MARTSIWPVNTGPRGAHPIRPTLILLALVLGAAVLEAQNTVYVTTNLYRIHGTRLAELRRSLADARPWKSSTQRHDALTGWETKVRYDISRGLDGFRCTAFASVTRITVALPHWDGDTNAAPEVAAEWNRYLRALTDHEGGHVQHAREATVELHRRVQSLAPQSDREALRANVDDLVREVQEACRARDAEYDQRTAHGLAQGAVFPLPRTRPGRAPPTPATPVVP